MQHGRTGVLVNTDNPEEWAESFRQYQDNLGVLQELRRNALQQLKQRHCLEKRAHQVSRLFQENILRDSKV